MCSRVPRARRSGSSISAELSDLAVLPNRQAILLVATRVLTLVTGVLHYATSSAVLTFVVAGLALAGLAWVVGVGTESVAARFGPAATGVLQSTLGNLPELFIV